ncbi:aspartyl protease family protein At5g10770-like [Miscanthus floridulus]|uniref:aspartyl protease family protein At5g10770-like n=1 Tax=Miscanthus floridulus TaxID=154761 RepID=UPI00345973A4
MASPLLLSILLCFNLSTVHGAGNSSFVTVPSSSFEPETVCSGALVKSEQNGSTVYVPLIPFDRAIRKIASSHLWKCCYFIAYGGDENGYVVVPTSSFEPDETAVCSNARGYSVDSLEYVVTVGFGTPAVQQTVLIDTGSDLSWVQCKPCNSGECSSQKDPLFDPSRSSSYSPARCDSDECKNLAACGDGCSTNGTNNQCRFGILYADGSRTAGVYSRDRLTLTRVDTVNNFRFGCGHDHRWSATYDGLLALGRLPMSLVVQTSSVYRGAFSYCLPAVNSRSGFLALGVRRSATWGFRLDLQPSAFAGGMMIDSGKVVTSLQSTAYRALRAAFRKAMAAYPTTRCFPMVVVPLTLAST